LSKRIKNQAILNFSPGSKNSRRRPRAPRLILLPPETGPGCCYSRLSGNAHRMAQDCARARQNLYGGCGRSPRYGDSSKPADGENHFGYSKRATAQDQVEVMASLGLRIRVVGHDRGGRVAHRMAADHPDRVTKIAVLDIVPTYELFHNVTKEWRRLVFIGSF